MVNNVQYKESIQYDRNNFRKPNQESKSFKDWKNIWLNKLDRVCEKEKINKSASSEKFVGTFRQRKIPKLMI